MINMLEINLFFSGVLNIYDKQSLFNILNYILFLLVVLEYDASRVDTQRATLFSTYPL